MWIIKTVLNNKSFFIYAYNEQVIFITNKKNARLFSTRKKAKNFLAGRTLKMKLKIIKLDNQLKLKI